MSESAFRFEGHQLVKGKDAKNRPLYQRTILRKQKLVLCYGNHHHMFNMQKDLLLDYEPLKPYINITLFDGLREPDSISLILS